MTAQGFHFHSKNVFFTCREFDLGRFLYAKTDLSFSRILPGASGSTCLAGFRSLSQMRLRNVCFLRMTSSPQNQEPRNRSIRRRLLGHCDRVQETADHFSYSVTGQNLGPDREVPVFENPSKTLKCSPVVRCMIRLSMDGPPREIPNSSRGKSLHFPPRIPIRIQRQTAVK